MREVKVKSREQRKRVQCEGRFIDSLLDWVGGKLRLTGAGEVEWEWEWEVGVQVQVRAARGRGESSRRAHRFAKTHD